MPTYLTPGVYVEEVDRGPRPLLGAGTAVAAFVGFTAKAPLDDPNDPEGRAPRLVTNWTQFENLFGGFAPGMMLPHSVFGFFNNGGGRCYIVRIPNTAGASAPQAALGAADRPDKPVLDVVALPGSGNVEVDIKPDPPTNGQASETFTLIVRGASGEERFSGATFVKGDHHVETLVNSVSKLITVKARTTDKALVPLSGSFPLAQAPGEPVAVDDTAFNGDVQERTGIAGLAIAEDITMICVPDLITAARKEDGSIDMDTWRSVQRALIDHCENQRGRMAILDAPPGLSAQGVRDWRSDVAAYDSRFAALYYPWLKVANPIGTNGDRFMLVPPSGHMAGIWARNDAERGVWKAPANEIVRGALDIERQTTKEEQEILNPIGVNCIRTFGTRGIRVWGARTLSSDTNWSYINVRRLFNMVETTIVDGTDWVVFEPNDQNLWLRVQRTLEAFLENLWREGALFGGTRQEAYFVKCDAETNPPEVIEQGQLIVEVGIAPVRPAEFVIFRLSQYQGGSTRTE